MENTESGKDKVKRSFSAVLSEVLLIVVVLFFLGCTNKGNTNPPPLVNPFTEEWKKQEIEGFLRLSYNKIGDREKMMSSLPGWMYDIAPSESLDHFLKSGGILGLRDYLIYLGKEYPEEKGRDGVIKLNGIIEPAQGGPPPFWTSLGRVLDIDALKVKGFCKEDVEYTYYEYARMIEKTIGNWRMDRNEDGDVFFRFVDVVDVETKSESLDPLEPPLPSPSRSLESTSEKQSGPGSGQ